MVASSMQRPDGASAEAVSGRRQPPAEETRGGLKLLRRRSLSGKTGRGHGGKSELAWKLGEMGEDRRGVEF